MRRFFPDFIVLDATVIAFLPPEENEAIPLWHLKYVYVFHGQILFLINGLADTMTEIWKMLISCRY